MDLSDQKSNIAEMAEEVQHKVQPNVVVQVPRTTQLPESFGDGDFELLVKRFDICAKANRWDADEKLLRLPLLLKGRAFAVCERHANCRAVR